MKKNTVLSIALLFSLAAPVYAMDTTTETTHNGSDANTQLDPELDEILEQALLDIQDLVDKSQQLGREERAKRARDRQRINELRQESEATAAAIARQEQEKKQAAANSPQPITSRLFTKTNGALVTVGVITGAAYYAYLAPRIAKRARKMQDGRLKNFLLAVSFANFANKK